MSLYILVTGAALALSALTIPSGAEAHAQLDSASPAVGSTAASSPGQVTLHFSEDLEPKFSSATVHDKTGARVDTGSNASGNTISVSIKSLGPGSYTVTWHVLSTDTHKTEGNFVFYVGK